MVSSRQRGSIIDVRDTAKGASIFFLNFETHFLNFILEYSTNFEAFFMFLIINSLVQ